MTMVMTMVMKAIMMMLTVLFCPSCMATIAIKMMQIVFVFFALAYTTHAKYRQHNTSKRTLNCNGDDVDDCEYDLDMFLDVFRQICLGGSKFIFMF